MMEAILKIVRYNMSKKVCIVENAEGDKGSLK